MNEIDKLFEDLGVNDDVAQEGAVKNIFDKVRKRAPIDDKLINSWAKKMAKKIKKNSEEANKIKAQIQYESGKFSENLKQLVSLSTKLKNGEIDKKGYKIQAAPLLKVLKETSDLVSYGQIVRSSTSISSEDLAYFKDMVKGLSEALKRAKTIVDSGTATESISDIVSDLDNIALESNNIDDEINSLLKEFENPTVNSNDDLLNELLR